MLMTDVEIGKSMARIAPSDKMLACARQFDTKGRGQQLSQITDIQIRVNFQGYIGRNFVHPGGLNSGLANQLVKVKGIITHTSTVRNQIQESAHYVPCLDQGHIRHYDDEYEYSAKTTAQQMNYQIPDFDHNGNLMDTQYGFCVYKDIQKVFVSELPENAPIGSLPRNVQVVLQDDLVDTTQAGQRVCITGVYKPVETAKSKFNGVFNMIILATGVVLQSQESAMQPIASEIQQIRKLSKRQDLFQILSRSIAPSIQGLMDPKKAVLLQQFGGVERELSSGTHVRGDINILLLGDPSTGKSQLMRSVLNISPRGIATTGRGATGVGLTAAVHVDRDTGERGLQAGAMVLADRGIICIDEFDKMNDVDRVAIHQVMEQQTVTIAKAGIHASLNARCSVLAAANPCYGSYIQNMRPKDNIKLPDSLLSRFDLLFITLDLPDAVNDSFIASRVIGNHSYHTDFGVKNADLFEREIASKDGYLQPGEMLNADRSNYDQSKEEQTDADGVFMKHKEDLHGSDKNKKFVSKSFLKKYITYAKSLTKPELTQQAAKYIRDQWNLLRRYTERKQENMPVTVRQLETLIRLSSAHAKMRLDNDIKEQDAKEAFRLLWWSVFNAKPSDAILDSNFTELQDKKGSKIKQKEQIQNTTSKNKVTFLQEEGYQSEGQEQVETIKRQPKREKKEQPTKFEQMAFQSLKQPVKRQTRSNSTLIKKQQKQDYDSIKQTLNITRQFSKMELKDKDEQRNNQRAIFLAAYQYANTIQQEQFDVGPFFEHLKKMPPGTVIRNKFKLPAITNEKSLMNYLWELDKQGKLVYSQDTNSLAII